MCTMWQIFLLRHFWISFIFKVHSYENNNCSMFLLEQYVCLSFELIFFYSGIYLSCCTNIAKGKGTSNNCIRDSFSVSSTLSQNCNNSKLIRQKKWTSTLRLMGREKNGKPWVTLFASNVMNSLLAYYKPSFQYNRKKIISTHGHASHNIFFWKRKLWFCDKMLAPNFKD